VQQGNSLVLLPGFNSQPSQPQSHHNCLNRNGDESQMDTSFPANQDAISQYSLIPYDAWNNPTIEAHNGGDPVPSNKFYCSWTDCSQSHKEHTAGELRKHLKTHEKPKQCPHYPHLCSWKGTAEERELRAHIKNNHEPKSGLRFTCRNCQKMYTEKKNLVRHQNECCALA
jgi:hypothetical protein